MRPGASRRPAHTVQLKKRKPSAGSAVRLAPKPGLPARQSAFNPTAFARPRDLTIPRGWRYTWSRVDRRQVGLDQPPVVLVCDLRRHFVPELDVAARLAGVSGDRVSAG